MHSLSKTSLATIFILCGANLMASAPGAMPANGLAAMSTASTPAVQKVVWLCSPFRCSWRPNYWGFYRGRLVWGPQYYWLNPRYYWGPRYY
jgi:hypothetical protein